MAQSVRWVALSVVLSLALGAALHAQQPGQTQAAATGAGSASAATSGSSTSDNASGAAPAPAEAAPAQEARPRRPGLQIGPGRLVFRFHMRHMYDNNINLEGDHEDADFIDIIAPSARYTMKVEHFSLDLGAEVEYWGYWDSHSASRTEYHGFARTTLEQGVFYGAGNFGYDNVDQPVDIAGTSRINVTQPTASALVGVKLGEVFGSDNETLGGLKFEYNPEWLHLFSRSPLVSFFEHEVILHTVRLRAPCAGDRVQNFLEATYGITDFEDPVKDDNIIRRLRGGSEWRVTDRQSDIGEMTLAGRIGYESRRYRDSSGTNAFTVDYEGLIGDLTARWSPWQEDIFQGGLSYGIQESTLTNFAKVLTWSASWSHRITEDLLAQLTGRWENSWEAESGTAQRFKDRRTIEAALRYAFNQDIVGEIVATYRDKATNDDTGEYDNFRTTVGITLRF